VDELGKIKNKSIILKVILFLHPGPRMVIFYMLNNIGPLNKWLGKILFGLPTWLQDCCEYVVKFFTGITAQGQ
jgi:hypothetical protein